MIFVDVHLLSCVLETTPVFLSTFSFSCFSLDFFPGHLGHDIMFRRIVSSGFRQALKTPIQQHRSISVTGGLIRRHILKDTINYHLNDHRTNSPMSIEGPESWTCYA